MTTQFTTDEFFAWLGQWSRLSDWQLKTTLAIASHVIDSNIEDQQTPPANAIVQKSQPNAMPIQRGYTKEQIEQLSDYVEAEVSYTEKERKSIKRAFAMEFGRSAKAIDVQISKIRVSKRTGK